MCIKIETGCPAIAIISAILTLVTFMASVVGFVTGHSEDRIGYVLLHAYTLILATVSLIWFIFSMMLCIGIYKRNPGLVDTYFIYGAMVTCTVTVAAISCFLNSDTVLGFCILAGCLIHTIFLVLVNMTYHKLRENNPANGTAHQDRESLVKAMKKGGAVQEKTVRV